MDPSLNKLLADLRAQDPRTHQQQVACLNRTAWLRQANDQEVDVVLAALLELDVPWTADQGALFEAMLDHLMQRQRPSTKDSATHIPRPLPAAALQHITLLYKHLQSSDRLRCRLLQLLTSGGTTESLQTFADLIAQHPPGDPHGVAIAFGPLFQGADNVAAALFPRLLDGLAHLSVAAWILDLANYLTREQRVGVHPAAQRSEQLASLLGGLVQRLGALEERPAEMSRSAQQLSDMVSQSVALAVALCDALALIGNPAAIGKLYQALEIGHRRLRTEAAAALARLGEDRGVDALVQMAAEPVARLRVLHYAEELGVVDKIDPQFQSPEARAQAQLVVWLAEPTHMGLAPTECELIGRRTQYWPGYDEPVDCFLFRFTYAVANASYSNVGIAGPLTYAFTADLADLAPDDIYAAFAGWQAEHDEILQQDAEGLSDVQRLPLVRLERRLHDAGYTHIEPQLLGLFFGDRVLVSLAQRNGVSGVAVADAAEIYWWPATSQQRSIGPQEAFCIYKGRKLLRTFNP